MTTQDIQLSVLSTLLDRNALLECGCDETLDLTKAQKS